MSIVIFVSTVLTALLIAMSIRLHRAFGRYKIKKRYSAAITAPSVTVCIPARNETHAMAQCIERVLASDYKKLEVIVLDDSSSDDTSILIRSFAHAGVRFIAGESLPEGWLGKNYALETLAREASGTYVMFIDVDTAIKPTTISEIVGYAMTESAEMVSVIPARNDSWRVSVLFGHLRYFWELLLARPSSPAVSGAFWMIKREALMDRLGGFLPFKLNISPETTFASKLRPAYRCLLSTAELGVTYEKKWSSQVETSRRLAFPMTGGTWWQGALGLVALATLNLPTLAVLSSVFYGWTIVQVAGLWFAFAFMALYASYTQRIWRTRWWLGGFMWPAVIFQELVLFVVSIWGYATHTITWKDRPVTVGATVASPIVKQ